MCHIYRPNCSLSEKYTREKKPHAHIHFHIYTRPSEQACQQANTDTIIINTNTRYTRPDWSNRKSNRNCVWNLSHFNITSLHTGRNFDKPSEWMTIFSYSKIKKHKLNEERTDKKKTEEKLKWKRKRRRRRNRDFVLATKKTQFDEHALTFRILIFISQSTRIHPYTHATTR